MLQKLPSLDVLAVLGAPHIGVTRAFSAFLEAKTRLFGSAVVLGICLKNYIVKMSRRTYRKVPRTPTKEYARKMRRVRDSVQSTRKICRYMRFLFNIFIYTEWILKDDRTIERWGDF